MRDIQDKIKDTILDDFCPVLYNIIKNNHNIILCDNMSEKLNNFNDWIKTCKFYNLKTSELLKDIFQPEFENNKLKNIYHRIPIYINKETKKNLMEKFSKAIEDFFEFLFESKLELRFKVIKENIVEEYFHNLNTNKKIHPLRQSKIIDYSYIRFEFDPRRKALEDYENFCKNEVKVIRNGNENIYFVFKKTGEKIPNHLQLKLDYLSNNIKISIYVHSHYEDYDPRVKALEIYNKKINKRKKKKIVITKKIINNETKYLCKKCDNFAYQLICNNICINCYQKTSLYKKLKN